MDTNVSGETNLDKSRLENVVFIFPKRQYSNAQSYVLKLCNLKHLPVNAGIKCTMLRAGNFFKGLNARRLFKSFGIKVLILKSRHVELKCVTKTVSTLTL
jgi:hypothetical protein